MILSHVLIQDECYGPFPVLQKLFNKLGRRHYIQAVKRYHENPSMLYTMIKSLCGDSFEQNTKMATDYGRAMTTPRPKI